MNFRESHFDKLNRRLAVAGIGILFLFLTSACDLKSDVEFGDSRKDSSKAPFNVNAPVASDQGGLFQGQTASGYKVSTSLGVQVDSVQGKTASGYDVRLNFQGKVSQ